MTTLEFTLPSNPGCSPLVCGEGNKVMVKLKTAAAAKSADGSGALVATIAAALATSLTEWKYTVEIDDSEIAIGQTVTAADCEGTLCCINYAAEAILAKLAALQPSETSGLNWIPIIIYPSSDGVLTADAYLFRRASSFQLHGWEIAIVSGSGTTGVRLFKSGANNETYAALTASLTITSPTRTARRMFNSPLLINANEALRASIDAAPNTGSIEHYGLELHLFTSQP